MKASKAGGKKPAAPDPGALVDQPSLPWTSRLWASVGLPWILTGAASYTFLTVLGRQFLHDPRGLDKLREQVPLAVYDRSTSIFLTALTIDLLNIVFERQTIKLDCVLLPAFIKGMASTTNILVRFFVPVMALTDSGRPVVVQRYICWMHTTPSILMLLKMISTTISPREALTAILFDEMMVVTGLAALLTNGWQRVLWSVITHVAMLPVVPYMHRAFTECMAAHRQHELAPLWAAVGEGGLRAKGVLARAMEQLRTRPLQLTMLFIYVLNLLLWCTFAVTWDLALLGWISVAMEEVLYVGCDFSAKVLFSSTLMLSSFKEFEARRESAMRLIEGSSKAKLITELQALLEQKERFMSSVSHELRTPLNGIIGISEGMLSGCCGVLPEGVRRQIYIIRTSGARLLALINDVMDAAALRQNKLVLKQEQVVLRHVVDDVLDLTRSLVDGEVVLANLVPPRMLVMGDSGRIVQILNNLLGNAAKFTRRGQIRVTARQVEDGRRVAVTVSDTGIGIPRNKLATIFLPFEQVDMSISRKYGGFGLGLNIVQELVKAHGGTINVSSVEGKGSTFTFTLPLARAMGRESLEEARVAAQRGTNLLIAASRQSGFAASAVLVASAPAAGEGSRNGRTAAGASASTSTPTATASAAASAATPPLGDGGGDDNSTVVSSSDASRRPGGGGGGRRELGRGGVNGTTDSELEQYGELLYNAAELSALASSRPYAQSVRDSMPSSLEGGNKAAVPPAPLIGTAAMVAAARGSTGPSRSGKEVVAVAAAGGGNGDGNHGICTAGEAAADDVWSLPLGETKIVHGPRHFHFTMYKRFLLLSVDDDPVNQSVVKSLLGSTGYEVVAVPSGPEALRYVSNSAALPDLVLLDCMMPDMDGYEVLQRLRALTPNVHLPIIMVSAQTEEEHVVCGLDLGADDYVTKPFKRNELLARIRAQLAYGEWEQDDGTLDTISSLVDFHCGGAGGGAITAGTSSELEVGNSSATVAPEAAAAAAVAAAGGGPQPGRTSLVHGCSGSPGDQRRIVCIDDDDVNQVVLQGMLTSQQYRYERASTGAQGLSYVCGTHNGGIPPDLVLLDCSLPDMTGFDVCRCIRQMYNKQQVPIIMLSARHNENAVVEGLKCGANTYVTKPFRRNELLARIRLLLRPRDPVPSHSPSRGDSGAEESDPKVSNVAVAALADSGIVRQSRGDSAMAAVAAPKLGGEAPAAAAASGIEATTNGGGGAGDGAGCGNSNAGVRVWTDAAVLVVAVADYAGLCRILMPAEMAELSARMMAAFDRAVATYGAVRIEASSGVMSAAVLPTAPPPMLLAGGGDAEAVSAASSSAVAMAGLRLAALHRVGRALLEAAAMLPVPGTYTCLQLQEALALGTVMGHSTAAVVGSTMLYFGPVLAELLDLARRAPPMTMVSPDGEAQALRASGATADIRGPLFLEPEDDAGGGSGGGSAAARRLWLVEAHPFAHQYLPPQLLRSASTMTGGRGGFQRSVSVQEADPVDKTFESASPPIASMCIGSGGAVAAAAAAAPPPAPQALQHQQHQQLRLMAAPQQGAPPSASAASAALAALMNSSLPGATASGAAAVLGQPSLAGGGVGSPLSTLHTSTMSGDPGHGISTSNSVAGFNASLGLYGISRAASRAFSQAAYMAGPDSEAFGRTGHQAHQSQSQHQPLQLGASTNTQIHTTNGNGNGGGGGGSTSQANCGAVSMAAAGGGGSASLPQQYGLGSPTDRGNARESASGGPCITFSLQAAAAAMAVPVVAAGSSSSGHFSTQQDPLLPPYGMTQAGIGGAGGGNAVGGAGGGGIASASSMPSTLFLYGGGQRMPSSASAAVPGGGGCGSPALDADVTAAEPQIRALRNELAAMRLQLETLQSGSARGEPFAALITQSPAAAAAAAPTPPSGSQTPPLALGLNLPITSMAAISTSAVTPLRHGTLPQRDSAAAFLGQQQSLYQPQVLQLLPLPPQPPQPSQQDLQQQQQQRQEQAAPFGSSSLAGPSLTPPAPFAASTDGASSSLPSAGLGANGEKEAKKRSKLSRFFSRATGKGFPTGK